MLTCSQPLSITKLLSLNEQHKKKIIMSSQKVAVVTGANKGIGFATVKGLCEKFQGTVYLTARNTGLGQAAVAELKKLGLNPQFHQLDVTDEKSIVKFKEHIKKNHGGIDILVNNAAIMYMKHTPGKYVEEAEKLININYFGLLNVCQNLFPLLRNNAQVVHVSSCLGHLSVIPSAEIKAKFSDPNLSIPELNKLVNTFLQDLRDNKNVEPWGTAEYKDYNVSKVSVCALARIQQREFDKEAPNRSISVNSVHPGYVSTDLNGCTGVITPDQGAVASLFLALGGHNLKAQLVWFDKSVVDWTAETAPKPF